MDQWHTCDTTHCRAGWAEWLGGQKGKELAAQTSTLFAAQLIFRENAPNIPVPLRKFFQNNEAAMADIKRCAELEAAAGK